MKPQKGNAGFRRARLGFGFVQGQAQGLQKFHHSPFRFMQRVFLVPKDENVVHIADVGAAFQNTLGVLIEFVQIDVCPML